MKWIVPNQTYQFKYHSLLVCEWLCLYIILHYVISYYCSLLTCTVSRSIDTVNSYCKCPNINNRTFGSLTIFCSTWTRQVKNLFKSTLKTAQIDFGLMQMLDWQPAPALQRLQNRPDIISKSWSRRCQMKHTHVPPLAVTSPLCESCNNTRLYLLCTCSHRSTVRARGCSGVVKG